VVAEPDKREQQKGAGRYGLGISKNADFALLSLEEPGHGYRVGAESCGSDPACPSILYPQTAFGKLLHPSRLNPPGQLRRIYPPLTGNPYGRQLTGTDPIPDRHFVEAENVADFGDSEQARARE
jgi:hypothetical protein